jgi:hypothetical protein
VDQTAPIGLKPINLNEPLHRDLNMPDAYGDVPPVEDMLYIAADGISDEVRKSRFTIRDDR